MQPKASTGNERTVSDRERLRQHLICSGLLELAAVPYAVAYFANGLEALMAAHYVKPTVAVMGVSMPILDGIEAARLLKASPSTRHVRVLAYTAWPSFYDGPLKSVFDGVLCKPSTSEALVAAVRRFAGGESALSAAAG